MTLLRNTFRANAAFSFITATLLLITSNEWLGIADADVLGIMDGNGFLMFIAIGTLIFGGAVMFVSSQTPIKPQFAWEIVFADLAWVLVSWGLLLTNALPFSTAGSWAVLIVADIVLLFGVMQIIGIRRI